MCAGKKTVAEPREIRGLRQTHWVMAASPVVRTIAVMAGWVWIVSEASDAVVAPAGETTAVASGVRFPGDPRAVAAWTLAVFGVGYGPRERRVRRVEAQQLETRLHEPDPGRFPGRTTGVLISRGDSPRDRKPGASGRPDGG